MESKIAIEEIRAGLAAGEFHLEYLPIVSLEHGGCVGGEALARWRRNGRTVFPSDFIPVIEETPLAGLLTYWVMETVERELGDWLAAHPEATISINVPPKILGRGALTYAAAKSGLDRHRRQIMLEVTERGVPDEVGLAALDAAVRDGARVALDDVTLDPGHLAILTRCALDVIKLERALIAQITPQCPQPAWLAGLAALLRSTDVDVIAEGVETEAEATALRDAGIPMAQGYHFSRPLPAAELMAFYAGLVDRHGGFHGICRRTGSGFPEL